ncbi:unnamed protein product [Penicillium olsonii]|nr:unnamed protein product [Penicillium olsonii]
MNCLRDFFSFLAIYLATVMAFPQQTITVTTATSPAQITQGPELVCLEGQTAVYTTDCTLGTPMSYCFSPEPPIRCSRGFFPSVWHPDHCMERSTCFPISAPWITTTCTHGALAYSTSTFYEGTVADGHFTVIKGVSCSCAQNQWTSTRSLDSFKEEKFCMPYDRCPPGMITTSINSNECLMEGQKECPLSAKEIDLCVCAIEPQTPVYPDWSGAEPTGCAF